ncbi:uncharacterized protein [Diadema antillarum]|uniref:uncharacterized protein n=1 Tax=Diadema antillarum TaxID=105358 RepID=UPI003A85D11C
MADGDEGNATPAAATSTPAVTAVSLKLPPFWPNDPALWFAQVEAQFVTRSITTQQTRFAYVISSLQPEIAQEVREFIISPPTTDAYDKVKAELIKRTTVSEQRRLHQLLTAEELGDRKPSQLLRRMKQLLGDATLEDSILKQLFLQRLPRNVQQILASTSTEVSIEQVAELADKIIEVATPLSVATVTAPPSMPQPFSVPSATLPPTSPSPPAADPVAHLTAQVAMLTTQVYAIASRLDERGRQRSRGSNRGRGSGSRGSSRKRADSKQRHAGSECYYHWKFGDDAQQCRSPCSRRKQKPHPPQQQGNGPARD